MENIYDVLNEYYGKLSIIEYNNNSIYVKIKGIIKELHNTHVSVDQIVDSGKACVYIPISLIERITPMEEEYKLTLK